MSTRVYLIIIKKKMYESNKNYLHPSVHFLKWHVVKGFEINTLTIVSQNAFKDFRKVITVDAQKSPKVNKTVNLKIYC